jgi:hypothetical protein
VGDVTTLADRPSRSVHGIRVLTPPLVTSDTLK